MSSKTELDESKVNDAERLFQLARQVIPGGLSRNTVYRSPHPDYADHGSGCHVTDLSGATRTDFANNMASLIHGHSHPAIVAAVTEQLQRGTAFTMATEAEFRLAKLLCDRVPWFEKIRFMNSGTEAVMAAIKAARAITGRPAIAKAEGTYHGTYDYAEVSQNSGPADWGEDRKPASIPVSKGTPQDALNDVVVFPFNHIQRTIDLLEQNADRLACVLIDLVPHRAGLIPASREYVRALREWCTDNDVLLVFDEVITFRMGFAGAAENYDVQPDLTTLGKIIGGGFPVGALAGTDEFMSVMDPLRNHQDPLPFPWSGTFAANPISMTAGRVAMELYDRPAVERLNQLGEIARRNIQQLLQQTGTRACVTGAGSMFRVHVKNQPPTEYRSSWQDESERKQIRVLVDHLYESGLMVFRTCTAALSTPMTEVEIDSFVEALRDGLSRL